MSRKTIAIAKALVLIGVMAMFSAAQSAEVVTYFYTNPLGSPVAGADDNGSIIWREAYEPFGKRIRQEAAVEENRTWYTGKPEDEATGLVYMGARHYNPEIGRFYAFDPVGFEQKNAQSFNRYLYVNNNPYKYTDPTGEVAESVWDAASLALSVGMFIDDPSWGNAAGVIIDAAATAVPFVPGGVGVVRNGANVAEAGVKTLTKADSIPTKTDRISEHLTPDDLSAARRELEGEVVAVRGDGIPFDHVKEVREAQQGLLNRIERIKSQLGRPGLPDSQRSALQAELSKASRLLDKSEEFVPRK